MNSLWYYQNLSQFLLSVKPDIPLITTSQEESSALLQAIDRVYSLVCEQIAEIQSAQR